MLKKSLLASAVMLFAVNAYAEDVVTSKDYYVRADATYGFSQKMSGAKEFGLKPKYNKPFGGQIGFGFYLPQGFRTDLNLAMFQTTMKQGASNSVTIADLEEDFPSLSTMDPTATVDVSAGYKTRLKVTTLMLNGYYDVVNANGFTPYIMAGVGAAHITGKTSTSSNVTVAGATQSLNFSHKHKGKTHFAWNAGVGVAYAVADNTAIDLGYKYSQFGKVDGHTLNVHQALLGLRFSF